MHGNEGFQPLNARTKQRNARPPGGTQAEPLKQAKRGKGWQRENNKRDQWQETPEF
jgi:hypothetical protein